MQNLITTLVSDIRKRGAIILPAGHAKFNWVDVENIGEVSAILLETFIKYKNSAIEITGSEKYQGLQNQILRTQVFENWKILISPFQYF